ncbi:MAG: hypothetical protein AAF611_07935 [Bacteroidota bacterium]
MNLTINMRAFFTYCSLLFITYSFCQNEKCNYITDYYQDVYKAQLYYLQEDYDKAYDILNNLNSDCKLLNQQEIYETIMYAELSARKGEHRKAYKLLKHAIINGYSYESIQSNSVISELLKKRFQKKLQRNANVFTEKYSKNIDSLLRKEIISMYQLDQDVREDLDYEKMKVVDSINQQKMKRIIKQYGFPNENLIGRSTKNNKTGVTFMLMHFNDIDYFKPILLNAIKNGECPPRALGFMVDSFDRNHKKYTYAMYRNLDSSEIKDFKNLDKRRIAIGLPPLETRKKIVELILKKYKVGL